MIQPVAVVEAPLDAAAPREAARHPAAGAVVLFEGCARDHHEGRAVDNLAYEAFVPMAVSELEKLRAEALARFGL
ncbi:MAG TPA: molybdenum cofactor biosynthesis protein MoaE, partial [Holophaga sp.]|nr:molybdenum cofactor biosynthesis protein MoaE [Holophaga sp.]